MNLFNFRRLSHNCPMSDSQSDIVAPRTETASLLGGGGVDPVRRPFSVQSDHRYHPHRHRQHHSYRYGNFLL